MKKLVLALCIPLLALPTLAQQDANRASREREALRRAQIALKAAQESQAGLQSEKAALSKDKELLAQQAQRARSQGQVLQAELKQAQQELTQLQAELEAQKRLTAEALAAAEANEKQALALQQQGRSLQALVDERTRVNQSLTALLERSTKALAEAEAKNQQIYAVGLNLIDHLRKRTPYDRAAAADPLFGLAAVRLENEAEELRTQLDQQRIVH